MARNIKAHTVHGLYSTYVGEKIGTYVVKLDYILGIAHLGRVKLRIVACAFAPALQPPGNLSIEAGNPSGFTR